MHKKFFTALTALCLALALLMTTAFAVGTTANFRKVNTYRSGQFTDVSSGAWYADVVKSAYELGLMNGTGGSQFEPEGTVSLAQAVALAARLHSIYYNGSENFRQSGAAWYTVYVDYAKREGILTQDYADYNAAATRAQFASLFARAFPASALSAINTVEDGGIVDVRMTHANAQEIYLLYRAGVLTGSGELGTFRPAASIQRSEAAAIVTRMALPEQRVKSAGDDDYTWQGDPALDFTAQLMDGSEFTLSEQAGKVVLVNFWATWCGPCVNEMPDLNRLYSEYSAGGEVEIILINCGESSRTVQSFLDRQGYGFPVACDEYSTISSAYGISAIPRTFVFGKDGVLLNDYLGSQSYQTFQSAITRALGS